MKNLYALLQKTRFRLKLIIDFKQDLVYYLSMATSNLISYEPLDNLRGKAYYWKEYVNFYEMYWGGPTSPFGVWFGNEYKAFRESLASNLEMDEREIEDCFFMKDEDGKHYVAPINSRANLLFSKNTIPLHWFVLFNKEDRKILYTHWGFNAIHYDARIGTAIDRVKEAMGILQKLNENNYKDSTLSKHGGSINEILKGLNTLKDWLWGFDRSGFIVLNYGEVCSLIHPSTLKNERSVEEIWNVIRFIERGYFNEASSSLIVLMQKWEEIKSKAARGGVMEEDTSLLLS